MKLQKEDFTQCKQGIAFKCEWPVFNSYKIITFEEACGKLKILPEDRWFGKEKKNLNLDGKNEKVIWATEKENPKLYNPAENAEALYDLFKLSEKEDVSEADILDYTHQYGLLGKTDQEQEGPLSELVEKGVCYPLKCFRKKMGEFNRLLTLYEQAVGATYSGEALKLLKERISFVERSDYYQNREFKRGDAAAYRRASLDGSKSLYINPEHEHLYKNHKKFAVYFLVKEVNLNLKGNISPVITEIRYLNDQERAGKEDFGDGSDATHIPWRVDTFWNCRSLLTALYFHLHNLISRRSPFRRCKYCGGIISPEKRADAENCSASCRVRYSRDRSSSEQ